MRCRGGIPVKTCNVFKHWLGVKMSWEAPIHCDDCLFFTVGFPVVVYLSLLRFFLLDDVIFIHSKIMFCFPFFPS